MQKRTARIFKKLAALTLCASLCVSFAATAFAVGEGEEPSSTPCTAHVAAESWASDATNHWHVCANCGAVIEESKAPHSFRTVVDQEATATKPGSQHQECGVCNYKTNYEEIKATGIDSAAEGPYVTAYTVTDVAGNEIQRITEGTKCRIIVAVVDPRIKSAQYLTMANGQPMYVNVKVASTSNFGTPSLGDISTTTLTSSSITSAGLQYSIILNDITFLGGTSNELSLDIAYSDPVSFLGLSNVKVPITQCDIPAQGEGVKQSTLVVKAAGYGSGDVTAGENFTLSTTVLVSGERIDAENVAVSLTLPEEITVVSGSSYNFVGNVPAGGEVNVSFLLTPSAAAAAGSYNITINVSGNSASDGAALSAQMPVTVPVIQPDRFEISNTSLPENMVMGEESYGTISLVNKGKGTVYNVEAKLEGEGFTVDEGANKYVGNIASGTSNTQDFSITPTQGGTINMLLTVSYEDEKANVKTITREFTVTVDDMSMSDPGGMVDPGFEIPVEEPQQGMPWWGWLLIVVAVLAVGGAVTGIVLKKRRAKRRAAQLMEDDDEDI